MFDQNDDTQPEVDFRIVERARKTVFGKPFPPEPSPPNRETSYCGPPPATPQEDRLIKRPVVLGLNDGGPLIVREIEYMLQAESRIFQMKRALMQALAIERKLKHTCPTGEVIEIRRVVKNNIQRDMVQSLLSPFDFKKCCTQKSIRKLFVNGR